MPPAPCSWRPPCQPGQSRGVAVAVRATARPTFLAYATRADGLANLGDVNAGDAIELELESLADRRGAIGVMTQTIARQGAAAWFVREACDVAGFRFKPDGHALPAEFVGLVPEQDRRLVTVAELEDELADLTTRQELLEERLRRAPYRDVVERLATTAAFAERHVRAAREQASRPAGVPVAIMAARGPRARGRRPSHRRPGTRARSRTPARQADSDDEPEPPLAGLRRLLARLLGGGGAP